MRLAWPTAILVAAPLGACGDTGPREAGWLDALDRLAAASPPRPPAEAASELSRRSAPRFVVGRVPEHDSADCEADGVLGRCMSATECAHSFGHTVKAGHCPGDAETQCCIAAGQALCDPDAVRQPNVGRTTEEPGAGGCPSGMARVAGFCVDRYEASLVDAHGRPWSPYLNPGHAWVRAVSVRWAVPQGYINGVEAADACAHAGKRLCRDEEWLRACRGPEATTYPYGDERVPGVCNDHRDEHPAAEYYGTRDPSIYAHIQNPCLNQLPESLERTGTRAECVTAEGLFDMMGNLHEWTADPRGTFRGGYYMDTRENGSGCLYVTTAHHTAHWDYSTGFRCCAVMP